MFDRALAAFERSLLVEDAAERERDRREADEVFDQLGVDVGNVAAPSSPELARS